MYSLSLYWYSFVCLCTLRNWQLAIGNQQSTMSGKYIWLWLLRCDRFVFSSRSLLILSPFALYFFRIDSVTTRSVYMVVYLLIRIRLHKMRAQNDAHTLRQLISLLSSYGFFCFCVFPWTIEKYVLDFCSPFLLLIMQFSVIDTRLGWKKQQPSDYFIQYRMSNTNDWFECKTKLTNQFNPVCVDCR